LTVHQNDGSYLAHTQGRKHQTNLARRAAREQKEGRDRDGALPGMGQQVQVRKNVLKIGRPGYRATKLRDPLTRQEGLLIQVQVKEIAQGIVPRVRFMSAYEQKVEEPDKNFQYLLIAAEPYNTTAFKIQAREVDKKEGRYWTWFDDDSKDFWIQLLFKTERDERYSNVPGLAPTGPRR
jgi:splicing factor 3A subunit 2